MKGLCKPFFIITAILACVAIIAGFYIAITHSTTASKPNIIFILADDMGWNDISFHGSDQIPTPNIDALGFNGVILNNHYVQPVCTPSRSALMTGKYPIHTGMQGPPILPTERRGLPLNETILAQHMKNIGYEAHIIGKWHLGYFKTEYTPLERGFDSHIGYWNGGISYYDHLLQGGIYSNYSGYDFRVNNSTAWDYQGKYTTDIFTEAAESLIENHDTKNPLFLYLPHHCAHGGNEGKWVEADQSVIDKFRYIMNPNRRTFAAMVSKLDESVGRVISALQKKDMLKNSVIVFMSDNGAPVTSFIKNYGSNQPFRGEKGTLWQGGVRTAACIWSPLIKNPSRVSHQLMHITDWLPTFYKLGGGHLTDLGKGLDGQDMWPTISQDQQSPRTALVVNIDERHNYGAIIATVENDNKTSLYKLLTGKNPEGFSGNFFHLQTTPMIPLYNPDEVLSSDVNIAIKKIGASLLDSSKIVQLRNEATFTCEQASRVPTCEDLCLFNLDDDPCEQIDLSQNLTNVLSIMKNKYDEQLKTLVPQPPTFFDYESDPAQFNYTWSAWMHD